MKEEITALSNTLLFQATHKSTHVRPDIGALITRWVLQRHVIQVNTRLLLGRKLVCRVQLATIAHSKLLETTQLIHAQISTTVSQEQLSQSFVLTVTFVSKLSLTLKLQSLHAQLAIIAKQVSSIHAMLVISATAQLLCLHRLMAQLVTCVNLATGVVKATLL